MDQDGLAESLPRVMVQVGLAESLPQVIQLPYNNPATTRAGYVI